MFGRSKTLPLLLVIAALGAALILKMATRGQRTSPQTTVVWSATREERVMLLDLLDRLEAKDPNIHDDAVSAREQILDDSRELLVGTTRLSNHFFDWDSMTQERVMLRAIHSPNAISKANRKAPLSE